MLRVLATLGIGALLALAVALPDTGIGRRGSEDRVRADVPGAYLRVGAPFPDVAFPDLQGHTVRLSELRGQPVLLVFERSADW